VSIFYISMIKAENACEACAELEFPLKVEYRNEVLEQIKTAMLEVQDAYEASLLGGKESDLLIQDYNLLVQACRDCNGRDKVIHRWTKKMVVLTEILSDEGNPDSDNETSETPKGCALN
jgi:hypothetical protein